jgi:hypothetical protein
MPLPTVNEQHIQVFAAESKQNKEALSRTLKDSMIIEQPHLFIFHDQVAKSIVEDSQASDDAMSEEGVEVFYADPENIYWMGAMHSYWLLRHSYEALALTAQQEIIEAIEALEAKEKCGFLKRTWKKIWRKSAGSSS